MLQIGGWMVGQSFHYESSAWSRTCGFKHFHFLEEKQTIVLYKNLFKIERSYVLDNMTVTKKPIFLYIKMQTTAIYIFAFISINNNGHCALLPLRMSVCSSVSVSLSIINLAAIDWVYFITHFHWIGNCLIVWMQVQILE